MAVNVWPGWLNGWTCASLGASVPESAGSVHSKYSVQTIRSGGSLHIITPCGPSQIPQEYSVRSKKNWCEWSCDCSDHKYRKDTCKHILSVQAYVIDREKTAAGVHSAEAAADGQPDNGNECNVITYTKNESSAEGIGEDKGNRPNNNAKII